MQDFINDSRLAPYVPFPKFLLDMPLPETAKILYVILLDRARLSLKNDGWRDAQGRTFQHFSVANMAETLHKSESTVKTCLAALEKAGLLERKRQGLGRPNRLYIKVPKTAENCPSDSQKSAHQTVRNLSPSKTNKQKTREQQSCLQNYDCEEYDSL